LQTLNTPSLYPWQQAPWQQLMNQFSQERLAHSFLCMGAEGLGQFEFANCFAWYMLCQDKKEQACGACQSCRLLAANTHPDLLIVQPEDGSKVIKIDQIRELVKDVQQTPKLAGYQVVVIDPADTMNRASSNALLKTLEEPPGRVLLFLISHRPAVLPATIISRCHRLNFHVPSNEKVLPWLREQLSPELDAQMLLSLALGQPLTAIELSSGDYLQNRQRWMSYFLPDKSWPTVVELSEKCGKDDVLLLLEFLQTVLQDLIRLSLQNHTESLIHIDEVHRLSALCQRGDLLKFYDMFDYLLTVKKQYQGQFHLNPQLIIEDVSLKWMEMFYQQRKAA